MPPEPSCGKHRRVFSADPVCRHRRWSSATPCRLRLFLESGRGRFAASQRVAPQCPRTLLRRSHRLPGALLLRRGVRRTLRSPSRGRDHASSRGPRRVSRLWCDVGISASGSGVVLVTREPGCDPAKEASLPKREGHAWSGDPGGLVGTGQGSRRTSVAPGPGVAGWPPARSEARPLRQVQPAPAAVAGSNPRGSEAQPCLWPSASTPPL